MRRWPAPAGAVSPQRLRARALGLLYAAGATVALLSLAVPHGSQVDDVAEVATALCAYPVGYLLFRYGPQLPVAALHLLLATGTVVASLGVYFTHGSGTEAAAAFFYVWVALYAAYFFPAWAVAGHLALVGAAFAAVLAALGGSAAPGEWVLVMGAVGVSAWVVGTLSRQLMRMANTDALTRLPNRRGAETILLRELARAERSGQRLAVAMIDLDNFKHINDNQGHQVGDQLLVDVARTWTRALRGADVLARYGGDEFLVVLPDTDVAGVGPVLDRLRTARVPYSAGVTGYLPGDDVDRLVGRADAALYAAKARGKGQVELDVERRPA